MERSVVLEPSLMNGCVAAEHLIYAKLMMYPALCFYSLHVDTPLGFQEVMLLKGI